MSHRDTVMTLLSALLRRGRKATTHSNSDFAGRVVEAMLRRGYVFDRGPGEINVVYVEDTSPDGSPTDPDPNAFNDARLLIRAESSVPKIIGAWEATTGPGERYTLNPVPDARAKGAARIVLGQQRCWQVGLHRGYEALVQTGGAVKITRDKNRDYAREGDEITEGWYGINQHHAFDADHDDIGSHSAGCLVGRTVEGHHEFMKLVKSDPRYRADQRFVFRTAILPAEWVQS